MKRSVPFPSKYLQAIPFSTEALPEALCSLPAPLLSCSDQVLKTKLAAQTLGSTGEDALIQVRAASVAPAGRQLSHTCTPPCKARQLEKLPVNVLKLDLQKERGPNEGAQETYCFPIKIPRDENILTWGPSIPTFFLFFVFLFIRALPMQARWMGRGESKERFSLRHSF